MIAVVTFESTIALIACVNPDSPGANRLACIHLLTIRSKISTFASTAMRWTRESCQARKSGEAEAARPPSEYST